MERNFSNVKRIVVKIGSSSLTYSKTHKINIDRIDRLAIEIADLMNSGIEVILVSSGAIASGMAKLNIDKKPKDLAQKQALASIGQNSLMDIYNKCFANYGYSIGQLLLTKYVIDHEQMCFNAKNCINQILKMGIVPIINENDVISVDEIKLGDNDNLSSIVARLVNADLLILLSDIDGIFDKDPKQFIDAQKIDVVTNVSDLKKVQNTNNKSELGTGGITTKIKACVDATNAGIDCVIANSQDVHVLKKILNNKPVGTYIKAKK